MIATALRTVAVLATLVLLASFGLFALDQAGGASRQAQTEVGASSLAQTVGPAIHGAGADHGVRGAIDDVNRALLRPVHQYSPGSDGSWGAHSFELGAGLLLYGVILGFIARATALAGHRARGADGTPAGQPHF